MKASYRVCLYFGAILVWAINNGTALAVIDVSLNLRYTNPADPNEGGSWTLVAISDDPNSQGIVDLTTRFTNMPASGTINPNIGHDLNGGNLLINTFGSETEFVYGQDPNDGLVANVGRIGGPSDLGADPLHNPLWDNASAIATGSIANFSLRPAFVSATANELIGGSIVPAAIGTTVVRGDSIDVDGLPFGDVTRNFVVNGNDLNVVAAHYLTVGTWDEGDVNNTGVIDIDDWKLVDFPASSPWGQYVPDEIPATAPDPVSISMRSSSRPVTEEEKAAGVSPGTVFDFFVTADQDMISFDNLDFTDIPIWNDPLGEDDRESPLVNFPGFEYLAADSFLSTPGSSWPKLVGPNVFESRYNAMFDFSDNGPLTYQLFARLTVLAGSDPNMAFEGRMNFNDGSNRVFNYPFSLSLAQPGDFDLDGDVDGFDFLAWQRGESPDPFSASDLAEWEEFYGMYPSPASVTTVPEPTTAALALAALCLAMSRRRAF